MRCGSARGQLLLLFLVPKLLLHRLFPDVRYSLWIDGKLKLVKDPYQLLERFLWRKNVSFAISGIIDALMSLRKLRPTRLVGSMIMLQSITK
ncbi:hypothetical protein ACQJBY_053868 [Aegilops geniculata]